MTKREIAASITAELDLPKVLVKQIVQRTLDVITDTLVTEGRIELRDFGVFEIVRADTERSIKVQFRYRLT